MICYILTKMNLTELSAIFSTLFLGFVGVLFFCFVFNTTKVALERNSARSFGEKELHPSLSRHRVCALESFL